MNSPGFYRCQRWSNVSFRCQCLLDNTLASKLCSCLQMPFYLLCFIVRFVFMCIWDWDWRAQLTMCHENMTLELDIVYPFSKSYLGMCQSNWILLGVLADICRNDILQTGHRNLYTDKCFVKFAKYLLKCQMKVTVSILLHHSCVVSCLWCCKATQ